MVDGEAALFHHLLDVAVGELISAIPPDAQKDALWLVVPPFERGLILFQENDSVRVIAELRRGL